MTCQLLHGATAQPQDLAHALAFDTMTGTNQNVVQMFWSMQQGFKPNGTTPQYTPFPLAIADALYRRGQLYLHTWSTYDWVFNKAWSTADVLAGRHDAYLHAQAHIIAAWKHPLFVRLDHEFNGAWAPWNRSGQDFVALWHYIVSLFKADGASNITWIWCPNELALAGLNRPDAADRLAAYLPDTADYDWTGFDAYNRGASAAPADWRTFPQMADLSYSTIQTLAPNKPMALAEFGCHPVGGDRPAWLASTLGTIVTSYPAIALVNYYNVTDGAQQWPLLAADGSAAAWAAAIARGPFVRPGFSMPPDLQAIVPMQTVSAWGDPLGPLTVQLGKSAAQIAGLGAQVQAATSDLTNARAALDQANVALAVAGARAQTQQSSLNDAQALLATMHAQLGSYQDAGRQVTDGLDALHAMLSD